MRRPSFSAASIIAAPIRSFTLPSGLKNSPFTAIVRGRTVRDAVELDERRPADAANDVLVIGHGEVLVAGGLVDLVEGAAVGEMVAWAFAQPPKAPSMVTSLVSAKCLAYFAFAASSIGR